MEHKFSDQAYQIAKSQYAKLGVNTDAVLDELGKTRISLHCWQGDDVGGFEELGGSLTGGGIQVTGNYPGKASSIEQLREDLEKVISLLPGKHKINLHAIYGDFGTESVDRDQIEIKHFQSWIEWAKSHDLGLDFNPTCFSHPKANGGFTLSSKNQEDRAFWIDHVKRCRKIAAEMGRQTGIPCVNNIWIPDGSKDVCVDRKAHRSILKKSLDEIFEISYPVEHLKDSVESKLFGIGSESMVVGSHDFYLGYAVKNNKLICLDNGHFHPTEQVGDKVSSCLQFVDEILLHLTRGVRWDSDHVLTFNDDLVLIAQEIVRGDFLNKVHIGLDFFDASINRIGAYVVGAQAARKALLFAMLEPNARLKELEEKGQLFERMALLEEMKTMPYGIIWKQFCDREYIPTGLDLIQEVQDYENNILSKRGN
jgi:L-rhamnose isomerase